MGEMYDRQEGQRRAVLELLRSGPRPKSSMRAELGMSRQDLRLALDVLLDRGQVTCEPHTFLWRIRSGRPHSYGRAGMI